MKVNEYIYRNWANWNFAILKELCEDEGIEWSEELVAYLKKTPTNTNWNLLVDFGIEPYGEDDGGSDYSKDCERTDLGELLYCGMYADFGEDREFDSNPNPRNGQFTAIIDGIEIQGTYDSDEDNIEFDGECVSTNFGAWQESEIGVWIYKTYGIAIDPEANPCPPRENYPNNHLALYYKAN